MQLIRLINLRFNASKTSRFNSMAIRSAPTQPLFFVFSSRYLGFFRAQNLPFITPLLYRTCQNDDNVYKNHLEWVHDLLDCKSFGTNCHYIRVSITN